jgi:hypothetical protein
MAKERDDAVARHDFFSAIVLAAATVMTAWCAFQASTFISHSAGTTAEATRLRIEAAQQSNQAAAFNEIDTNLWVEWVRAALSELQSGDTRSFAPDGTYTPTDGTQSAFYYYSFRKEMLPAFAAWLATGPFEDPNAPAIPFVLPEYELKNLAKSERLSDRGFAAAAASARESDDAHNYVFLGVVSASALALAGLAMKLQSQRVRAWMIGFSAVIIAGVFAVALTFPIDI